VLVSLAVSQRAGQVVLQTYFTMAMSSSIILPSCAWLMPIGIRAACCCAVARCWPPLLRCGAGAAAAKASSDKETSLYMVKAWIDS
jgi:hypothetical protein